MRRATRGCEQTGCAGLKGWRAQVTCIVFPRCSCFCSHSLLTAWSLVKQPKLFFSPSPSFGFLWGFWLFRFVLFFFSAELTRCLNSLRCCKNACPPAAQGATLRKQIPAGKVGGIVRSSGNVSLRTNYRFKKKKKSGALSLQS